MYSGKSIPDFSDREERQDSADILEIAQSALNRLLGRAPEETPREPAVRTVGGPVEEPEAVVSSGAHPASFNLAIRSTQ